MTLPLPEDFVDFMESGISVLVASRDAQLRPECVRAVGVSIAPDRLDMTVFLSEAMSALTLENIAANRQIAVAFSRPIDHRSLQAKGEVTTVRPATDDERRIQERYLTAYAEQLYLVGMPRSLIRRVRYWPSRAVTFRVRDVFVQTPGPGAGRRLEAPERVA